MAHSRARDEWKERQWRRWIGECQTTGLSVRAFCDRRGLAVPAVTPGDGPWSGAPPARQPRGCRGGHNIS